MLSVESFTLPHEKTGSPGLRRMVRRHPRERDTRARRHAVGSLGTPWRRPRHPRRHRACGRFPLGVAPEAFAAANGWHLAANPTHYAGAV